MYWNRISDDLLKSIIGCIFGTADDFDRELLEQWLSKDVANGELYKKLTSSPALAQMLSKYVSYDTEAALAIIKSQLIKKRRKQLRFRRLSVAACLTAAIASIFFLTRLTKTPDHSSEAIIATSMPLENISLISGGLVMTIAPDSEIIITEHGVNNIAESRKISDSERIVQIENPQYDNHLIVPRGRRASALLPDGSKVWLNSGTELHFPSVFGNNERKIRVVGEIFIDVVTDQSRPFLVEANEMRIKATGTRFNISCYPEDSKNSVVLVDGSVEVSGHGSSVNMKPGQMYELHGTESTLSNVNIEQFTSWRDGYLLWEEKVPILSVFEKIGRYYNVNFSRTENEALASRTCRGKLILFDDVDTVLKNICLISGTIYERDNETIYIKIE